jgi:hypothetical protein
MAMYPTGGIAGTKARAFVAFVEQFSGAGSLA